MFCFAIKIVGFGSFNHSTRNVLSPFYVFYAYPGTDVSRMGIGFQHCSLQNPIFHTLSASKADSYKPDTNHSFL